MIMSTQSPSLNAADLIVPCRVLSYGDLSGEPAACLPARGERWGDCAQPKHAEVFALIALDPQKRGFREHWWLEQRICQKPRRARRLEIEYQLEMGWLLDR